MKWINKHLPACLKSVSIYLVSILSMLFFAPTFAQSDDICKISERDLVTASSIVDELHGTLLTVMKDADSLGYEGRYELLSPVISKHFNTPLITQTILGRRYWENLADEQKDRFIDLFQELSIATYASRFDGYSGESFAEIERKNLPFRGKCPPPDGREPPAKRIIVKTELRRVDDGPVKLEYLQQFIDNKWYIITVIANGVNDLSLKRGEYSDVIKKKGFDGLVEELQTKIKEMESGIE